MASLQHHVATLLAFALVAGCGGDRSRAAAGTDTTGAAAVTPDSAAMPARTTAAPADTSSKHAAATQPARKKMPVAKAESATAPQQQDTSKATTGAAEQPLRDAYHQAPRDTVSPAVYDGWKQFNLNCARCHGEDALGTTIAPHLIMSLKPTGPINSKELFVQTVCAGRPEKGMPSWCALGLDMSKINDIYEYVKGRSDAKISPGRPAVKQQG
jgi:mono/diheme cytochrome c family protein